MIFAELLRIYYQRVPYYIERLSGHKRNSDRFKAIADSSNDGIIEFDFDTVIHYANQSACRMFGYEDLSAMSLPEIISPLPPINGHVICQEITGIGVSGNRFPIEATLSSFEVSDGRKMYTAIMRDITKRKQLQRDHG